jgi:AcrR family transcriptional regulator
LSSEVTQLVKESNEAVGGLAAYRSRIAREKRSAILDAAVARFVETGYDRTSLEAIARAASVSTGTLFKYFPTKASLFGALMARAWANDDNTNGAMPPPGDPAAGLLWIGLDYARLLRAPGVEALFRLIIAEAPRFPELGQQLYEKGKAPYLARLEAYLQSEAAGGRLHIPDGGMARAARELLGMINDQIFWPRFLILDLEVPDRDVDDVVRSAVSTFLARYGAGADDVGPG